MYKIKSNYVKSKIKGMKFNAKNREYIEALMFIERYITHRGFGWNTGYIWAGLKEAYPVEIEAIWTEIDPKGYKRYLKEIEEDEKREKKEDAEFVRKENAEAAQEKRVWKKYGGKL